MKKLIVPVVVVLAGCATQPAQEFDRSAMVGFKPNCGQARSQVDFLQKQIDDYHVYFQSRTPSQEDRRYYSRLKNNIWALRASCSALQR